MKEHAGVISKVLVANFLLMLALGCATLVKGGKQTVELKSIPQGSNCDVYNQKTNDRISTVTTPAVLTLERGSGYFKSAKYRIRCNMANYTPQEALLDGSLNGYYMGGNILLGGLIGWLIIDPLTGAMYTLEPETVLVDFQDPTKSQLIKPAATDNTKI